MLKLLTIFKRFLPLLPYIIIAAVVFIGINHYNNLVSDNIQLESELHTTQNQLEDFKDAYVKQKELSELRDRLNTELRKFTEERHQQTIDFIQSMRGIEDESDYSNTLNPDVVRMLQQELEDRGYTEE